MEQKYYDLTNPQKSIWYTEQVFKEKSIGNICGTMLINELVDIDLLKKTVELFIQKNDAIRTRIVIHDGIPKQFICNDLLPSIEVLNLNSENELHELEEKCSSIVFNLTKSSLCTFKVFKLPNGTGGIIPVLHHLISDAWSFGLMSKEFKDIYEKLLSNKINEICDNPSYTEYIENEKDYLNSDKFTKDKEYWESRFSDIPELAIIKPYKSNISEISTAAIRYSAKLDAKLCSDINAYAKVNNSSAYSFLMSIYAIYLSKVSNIDNVIIGTPFLNRSNYKEKSTMGMFVNTLPNRLDINWNTNFKDFLKYTTLEQKTMFRHSKYPYDALLEHVRKEHNISRNLYDLSISYQNARNDSQTSNINYCTYWNFNYNISDSIQINVFDMDNTGALQILYDYQTSKFTNEEVIMLHNRILNMINQVLKNEICLKDIEIVTSSEKKKLLYDFNNTKVTFPQDKTIIDLFEEQAQKTPNNIALVFNDNCLTYKQLNEKANALASKILSKNLKNKYICIICDKNIEMIISILATLKSSNCYIPIDPNSPKNRIKFIIDTTNSSLLLTTQKYAKMYSNYNSICVGDLESLSLNINKSSPTQSAYIIFTSGTTGNPKGVEVLHQSIVNTLLWRKNYYKFNEDFTTLQLPSFAFDSSVEDIFTTLISGGKLVLPTNRINDVNS